MRHASNLRHHLAVEVQPKDTQRGGRGGISRYPHKT